jgi:hypothetical protein
VVETREIAHELMFKGSKPTAIGTLKEKILHQNDPFTSLIYSRGTVVEKFTREPTFKGSNPAANIPVMEKLSNKISILIASFMAIAWR